MPKTLYEYKIYTSNKETSRLNYTVEHKLDRWNRSTVVSCIIGQV